MKNTNFKFIFLSLLPCLLKQALTCNLLPSHLYFLQKKKFWTTLCRNLVTYLLFFLFVRTSFSAIFVQGVETLRVHILLDLLFTFCSKTDINYWENSTHQSDLSLWSNLNTSSAGNARRVVFNIGTYILPTYMNTSPWLILLEKSRDYHQVRKIQSREMPVLVRSLKSSNLLISVSTWMGASGWSNQLLHEWGKFELDRLDLNCYQNHDGYKKEAYIGMIVSPGRS